MLILILFLGACNETVTCEFDTSEPASEDWRPEVEIILDDVVWVSQQQEGVDSPSNNCGPATLEMARAYARGEVPTFDPGVKNIITWMDVHRPSYAGTGVNYQGSGVTATEMAITSSEYLHLLAEAFGDDLCAEHMDLEGLYNELLAGRPVMIRTYSQEGGDVMSNEGTHHFMLLVGMTPTDIVVYDPLWYYEFQGAFRHYTITSFLEEGWYEHGGVRWLPYP